MSNSTRSLLTWAWAVMVIFGTSAFISLPVNNAHPVDSCGAPAVESLQRENVRQAKTKVAVSS